MMVYIRGSTIFSLKVYEKTIYVRISFHKNCFLFGTNIGPEVYYQLHFIFNSESSIGGLPSKGGGGGDDQKPFCNFEVPVLLPFS